MPIWAWHRHRVLIITESGSSPVPSVCSNDDQHRASRCDLTRFERLCQIWGDDKTKKNTPVIQEWIPAASAAHAQPRRPFVFLWNHLLLHQSLPSLLRKKCFTCSGAFSLMKDVDWLKPLVFIKKEECSLSSSICLVVAPWGLTQSFLLGFSCRSVFLYFTQRHFWPVILTVPVMSYPSMKYITSHSTDQLMTAVHN